MSFFNQFFLKQKWLSQKFTNKKIMNYCIGIFRIWRSISKILEIFDFLPPICIIRYQMAFLYSHSKLYLNTGSCLEKKQLSFVSCWGFCQAIAWRNLISKRVTRQADVTYIHLIFNSLNISCLFRFWILIWIVRFHKVYWKPCEMRQKHWKSLLKNES